MLNLIPTSVLCVCCVHVCVNIWNINTRNYIQQSIRIHYQLALDILISFPIPQNAMCIIMHAEVAMLVLCHTCDSFVADNSPHAPFTMQEYEAETHAIAQVIEKRGIHHSNAV
jgi:hypothetical protein